MPKKVEIYTTPYCPYCHAAKNFLKSKKIEFVEIDASEEVIRRELVKITGGRETVPQIFSDGKLIGGYDDLVQLYRSGKSL